ncbi:hypothetical protein CDD80_7008 [Ophiocordyceps camponoti-rufipedis]|uniref:DNA polymerase epsilon subunit D n=1 Tax=Ophiocordyceps camponoti-rufipedis TaxID=2004952 RepID=A0A2C5YP78_9HYPO|nr:hypothetical protein CDD80_7008 [Ophiocordyceps camponoti-rufipedis]
MADDNVGTTSTIILATVVPIGSIAVAVAVVFGCCIDIPPTTPVLARAPNARPGLTDQAVQGEDAFVSQARRQPSRLAKPPPASRPSRHGRSKSSRATIHHEVWYGARAQLPRRSVDHIMSSSAVVLGPSSTMMKPSPSSPVRASLDEQILLSQSDIDPDPDPEPEPDDRQGNNSQEKRDRDHSSSKDGVPIEDLSLPKSIITRLAKGVLPPNTQIQANAILAMSKGATVFISYLASHANEHTASAGKKTISPADVFKALDDTEFSFLREPLEAEFAKFNAVQTEKRSSYRQKVRAAKDALPDSSSAHADQSPDEARDPKRPRLDDGPSSVTAAADTDADDADPDVDIDAEPPGATDIIVQAHDHDVDNADDADEEDDDADDVVDEDDEEDDADEDEVAHHRPADAGGTSGDETQEADEALDGDESD